MIDTCLQPAAKRASIQMQTLCSCRLARQLMPKACQHAMLHELLYTRFVGCLRLLPQLQSRSASIPSSILCLLTGSKADLQMTPSGRLANRG